LAGELFVVRVQWFAPVLGTVNVGLSAPRAGKCRGALADGKEGARRAALLLATRPPHTLSRRQTCRRLPKVVKRWGNRPGRGQAQTVQRRWRRSASASGARAPTPAGQ